jgi:NADH-quinone oxidoreductase subunit I
MNNRYLRKAWTKEEAHEQDKKGVEAQPRTQL